MLIVLQRSEKRCDADAFANMRIAEFFLDGSGMCENGNVT